MEQNSGHRPDTLVNKSENIAFFTTLPNLLKISALRITPNFKLSKARFSTR